MTDVKVIDASALAAILFDEPDADMVAKQVHGAALVAPRLLSFELANTCWKKCRRDPDRKAALTACLRAVDRRGIEELPVSQEEVLILALESGLTTYDSSYLWLAIKLKAELVTLDKALARAWSNCTAPNTPTPPPA